MRGKRPNPTFNHDFFNALPSDIIIDILTRLPLRTILSCTYVCKSWHSLIHSHEFYMLHLPKSVPLLAIHHFEQQQQPWPNAYSLFEVEDGGGRELCFNPLTKVNLPDHTAIRGSANGFLFLTHKSRRLLHFVLCNPITREYIELDFPRPFFYKKVTYGLGASKITGQVKVVRVIQKWSKDNHITEYCYCQVYTLGTGSWRRIASPNSLKYGGRDALGSFLNGNLHWLVQGLDRKSWISCFDLETELFHTFSTPDPIRETSYVKMVAPLGDCLCLCDNTGYSEIIFWVMKEYGVEKSWTKGFVIQNGTDFNMLYDIHFESLHPIKVLKDSILIAWEGGALRYYYKKRKNTQMTVVGKCFYFCDAILYSPSFLSLKSLGMENVQWL